MMQKINKPDFNTSEVFTECISIVQNAVLKQKLNDCIEVIKEAEIKFDNKFINKKIHEILPNDSVHGTIGKIEMEKVYTDRMVPKGKPGRVYYDKIFLSAPNGKCPLCLQRIVTTLDHYLPKAKFPIFSVTPINLIPACGDCNKIKLATIPQSQDEQTLHPYYDEVEEHHWLRAEVLKTNPISFDFFVADGVFDAQLTKRLKNHLEILGIKSLYGTHAAEELQNIKRRLLNLYISGGKEEVQSHLFECYDSGKENILNSWYTATYHALANDEWFCSEGLNTL